MMLYVYIVCAHFGHNRNALYIRTLRRFYDHLGFERGRGQ